MGMLETGSIKPNNQGLEKSEFSFRDKELEW